MPVTVRHKRGVTFEQIVTIPAEFADAYFSGWTPKCEIRNRADQLVATATCTWVDPATTRELKLRVADTDDWPIDSLEFDIAFSRNIDGHTLKTDTARLLIEKDVTR
jgi:hypothetical protein